MIFTADYGMAWLVSRMIFRQVSPKSLGVLMAIEALDFRQKLM